VRFYCIVSNAIVLSCIHVMCCYIVSNAVVLNYMKRSCIALYGGLRATGLPDAWLSQKYRTLSVPMTVAHNIELLTYALSGIRPTIIFIPDKESKYRTVRLNTRHLATILRAYLSVSVHVNCVMFISRNLNDTSSRQQLRWFTNWQTNELQKKFHYATV